MSFQYTYEDWKEGRVLWNSILSHSFESDYISEECRIKIKKDQKRILKDMAKQTEKNVHYNFIEKYRASEETHLLAGRWFETIDNLFNGDINMYEETEIVDMEKGLTKSHFDIDIVCVIPPAGLDKFNKRLIELIRNAKQAHKNTHKWNHNTVQTSLDIDLLKHQDFCAELYARTYTDFAKRLRRYRGLPINTFNSSYEEFSIRRFKVDLQKRGLIETYIDTDLFVKIFNGYLLLRIERINWLESLDGLHYLIDSLTLITPDGYGVWNTVSNCFTIKGKEINSDNLRKANKCSSTLSEVIDYCISSLK